MSDELERIIVKYLGPVAGIWSARLARRGKSDHSRAAGVLLVCCTIVVTAAVSDGRIDDDIAFGKMLLSKAGQFLGWEQVEKPVQETVDRYLEQEDDELDEFLRNLGLEALWDDRTECMSNEAWIQWRDTVEANQAYQEPACLQTETYAEAEAEASAEAD